MTESEQDRQWRTYACGPRCLIESPRGRAKCLTKEAIITFFGTKIAWWGTQCGLSSSDNLLDMARQFGLHSHLLVTEAPDLVVKHLEVGSTVIAATKRRIADGTTVLNHYYLVESASTAAPASSANPSLRLFGALQDGGEERFEIAWFKLQVGLPMFLLFCDDGAPGTA